jgi:hypothetical protein
LLEAHRILQALLAELPDEARTLVDKINREITRVEVQTQEEVTRIRQQAEGQVVEVENKAENRRRALLQQAVEQLEPLQKQFFRAGELGKALATLVQIQTLRGQAQNILPDPGNLLGFAHVGKTYHFRVTGSNQGPLWGTDIYTADSCLAAAAVHAGALKPGEEAVVRVSVVDMSAVPVRGQFCNESFRSPLGE